MKNKYFIPYLIFLGLFSIMILASVYNHIFNYEVVVGEYAKLGYPEHLIAPMVIAQLFGLFVIIYNKGELLLEWAYAGFFINLIFAIIAHYVSKHGNGAASVICLTLLWSTYSLNIKAKQAKKSESKKAIQIV
ncbi:dTDP-D-glucose 4,6-dehydratase [Saonia flava]|uniref:dTDP-D-glucose 4,6-dehydratase n=1 Tax=Saonia flava TaxID=523696 RepID=A0A846QRG3_9FLAO|nr:DoxX family protein [Saonia flava]NJB70731.1 dTDP-D-glucose 4,6-dehydratase [Saonia flava]